MATLGDLLKYKEQVALKNPKTGKTLKKVWIRILGDDDLKEAFKYARVASSDRRKLLRDPESAEYKDAMLNFEEQGRAQWESIILAARENQFANEAPVIVPREDLPKIEEIAMIPDAPTLEEQERMDTETQELDDKFIKAVEEYIETKLTEVRTELAEMDDDAVLKQAMYQYANIEALQAFSDEINDQRGFRGTFLDEACKARGYADVQDFKSAHSLIKTQIINAYNTLERTSDDLKE